MIMLKYLAILAVIFALACYVAVQDQGSTPKSTQQGAPAANLSIAADAHQNHSNDDAENTKRNSPRWHRLFSWPEGVTTWAIILTLLAVAEQAKESAKATQSVRDSLPHQKSAAEAALLNAQAVINAERPWIFVAESKSRKAIDHRKADVQIFGKNSGRTPAEVIVIACDAAFRSYDKDFPDEPWYPQVELKYKKYVAPEETFDVYDYDCALVLTEEMWESVKGQRLTFTGRVVYRDLITREEHETRFCYFLSPVATVGLIMCGPRNYNQHT